MPFFEAEDFNADIVEEAVQRLLSVYHSQGHPFTEISHVITEKDDLISLNFNILEGQQVTTGNITFIGNSLNVKGLKEIMSLKEGKRYNTGLLDSDRDTLQDFYNSLGYLFATIEDFQTTYQENSQTMILW
jgi:outer membrane protein assembly factor BamA